MRGHTSTQDTDIDGHTHKLDKLKKENGGGGEKGKKRKGKQKTKGETKKGREGKMSREGGEEGDVDKMGMIV